MNEHMEKIEFSSEVFAYLRDESSMVGKAEKICFPQGIEELQAALESLGGECVTVQGARTGLCGGAVPDGGSILNMSKMKAVKEFVFDAEKNEGSITLEAGVTLGELGQLLSKKKMDTSRLSEEGTRNWEAYQKSKELLWFLPNPTETEASLGGIAATNAVGSHIGAGGGTKENILAVKVVLSDGRVVDSTADFCGTEGKSGIAAELKLRLTRYPKYRCGLFSFHHTYKTLQSFYEEFSDSVKKLSVEMGAADWFAAGCSCSFPANAACALWIELWGENEDEIYEALENALEILETRDDFSEQALAATNEQEFLRLENVRHTVTEEAGAGHNKKTVLLDWRAGEDAMLTAEAVTEMLRDVPHVLLGHMAYGMTTLYIQDEEGQWEECVTKLLLERHCRYSWEHGSGKRKKEYKMKFCFI